MILGKFFGTLKENKDKIYVVVDCPTKDEAIKKANKLFKVKKDTLTIKRVYIASIDDDNISFDDFDGAISVWAVYKK